MKAVYIIAIVITVAVIIAVVSKAVATRVMRKRNRTRVLETCALTDTQTIFVSLVSWKDSHAAGATL